MRNKFIKLYENTLTRYNRGGFLTSDVVKFVDNALSDRFFQSVNDDYKAKVKEFAECEETLRVKNVKSTFPAVMGAGNPDYNGYSFGIEVCKEIAPGKFSPDTITVPQNLLYRIDSYPNLPEVPDKHKYVDRTHIDPKTVDSEDEETPFFSPSRTKTTDRGNKKDSKTDLELPLKNTRIPSSPVKGVSDPASYTANYLP
jgi:hypothetical protein